MYRGFMYESTTPSIILTFIVLKKDSSWHMCFDSRVVNMITINYRFLIPRLDYSLDQLHDTTTFSKISIVVITRFGSS